MKTTTTKRGGRTERHGEELFLNREPHTSCWKMLLKVDFQREWKRFYVFIVVVLFADFIQTVYSSKEPPVLTSSNEGGPHQQRHSKQTKKLLLRSGESLKLVCPVEQNLDTIVEWLKNGQIIHIGWDRYKMNDAILRAKDVVKDDSGIYTCKATNGFGSVNLKFYVYVYSNESRTAPDPLEVERFFREIGGGREDHDIKPFITELQNYTVNIGDSVTWFCDVYTEEEPKIQWFKKIEESPHAQQGQRSAKNDTIYIGGSQYIPVAMDASLKPSSSDYHQKAALFSSRLDLTAVDYNNQGMYLCAVFTPSYFDYKTAYVRIAGSDDQADFPRRRVVHPTPETSSSSRDDLTYVILIVIASVVVLVVVIVVLVTRRLRSNSVARNRGRATQDNSKKGCARVPQLPPHQQPMILQHGLPPGKQHPPINNQYTSYSASPLTSSPLPQNYPTPAANMVYPVVGTGNGIGDESFSSSTLPSNIHLHNAYQTQPKLTTQQLKLFQQQQQQQQQQQIVALYDCGEC